MTIYNMSKMAAGVQPRVLPAGYGVTVLSSLAFAAVALAIGDVINALQIQGDPAENPVGPSMIGVGVDTGQLDTGNTLAFTVGDAANNARYISASNIGRTGGIQTANVGGSIGYQPFLTTFTTYPSISKQVYTLGVYITATATTAAGATMTVKAEFTYDP
jgi:hypothetical protein